MAGRVRRGLVGLVLLGGSPVAASTEASAAGRPAEQLQWRGYAAEVVLTDCTPADAPGTTCQGWDVFAFRERVGTNGDRIAHRVISVTVYDVTITADPLAPAVTPRSGGFVEDADVTVTPNLSRAWATGTIDLFECDEDDCSATGESVDVDIAWTAAGPSLPYRDRLHLVQEGGGGLLNVMFFGRSRAAAVLAEVGGESVHVVPEQIVGRAPQLHFDASTELCVRDCFFPEP